MTNIVELDEIVDDGCGVIADVTAEAFVEIVVAPLAEIVVEAFAEIVVAPLAEIVVEKKLVIYLQKYNIHRNITEYRGI